MNKNLIEEAGSFDRQIEERIKNGHIPDLRLAKKCEYFYNNPWRHPEYVKLDMLEQFEIIRDAIEEFCIKQNRPIKVLEVGSGPGYLSLELARQGYDVLGIDISSKCIEVAEGFAASDPWKQGRGRLEYAVCDFLSDELLSRCNFDAIVFLGSLHHFPSQKIIMDRARELLHDGGIIIAHEPTRDRVTEGNTAFVHLVQLLLSMSGGYYKKVEIPDDPEKYKSTIKKTVADLKYEDENGEKLQSVNDNEAGYSEMYHALNGSFEEVLYKERYAFFHEVIGGLRFDETTNIVLARFLKDIDSYLCQLGVLQSTEMFFVGRKQ